MHELTFKTKAAFQKLKANTDVSCSEISTHNPASDVHRLMFLRTYQPCRHAG